MPIQVAIRNSQTTPDAEKPCSLSESPTLTSEKRGMLTDKDKAFRQSFFTALNAVKCTITSGISLLEMRPQFHRRDMTTMYDLPTYVGQQYQLLFQHADRKGHTSYSISKNHPK